MVRRVSALTRPPLDLLNSIPGRDGCYPKTTTVASE